MNDQKGKLITGPLTFHVSLQHRIVQPSEGIPTTTTTPGTWKDIDQILEPIEWDWPGWLPKGFLAILAGDSGIGKSTLLLFIGACYTQGLDWPDGSQYQNELGAVLWCETEAAQALNLARAKKLGLPLDRFYTPLDNPLDDIDLGNPNHKDAIREIAYKSEVRLVILDSLRGAHRGNEDSNEMFDVVNWLAELARDVTKPIIVSHHLRKRNIVDREEITLDRLRGSTAILQPARMIWALARLDPHLKENLTLSVIKSSLEKYPEPIGVRITDTGVNFAEAPQPYNEENQTDKAIKLLQELLENGPVPTKKIEEASSESGISMSTMRIAKKKLGIKSIKGDGKDGGWTWSFPVKDINLKAI